MRFATCGALVMCALAGCGIGSSDNVEEIQPGELVALDQTSTTSTPILPADTSPDSSLPTIATPPPPASGPVESIPDTTIAEPTELVELYFVNGSEIVPVATPVAVPGAERRILAALGVGPPPAEFEAGVRTAVPPGLVVGFRKGGALATVDLDSDLFSGIDSDNQRYVVAQIVLTLTRLHDIDNVLFTVDGEPLRVYQRTDELTEPGEPVSCEDYEELLAQNGCAG